MGYFHVDEIKCRRDGHCVAVCPMQILKRSAKEVPRPIPGAEGLCLGCGHCVAVCPQGACALATMPVETCPPVRPEWRLTPEQAEHFLRSRRSIRAYKDEPVDPGRLEHLIRVARYAPSGHNRQPVRWLVISSKEEMRALGAQVAGWMRHICEAKPERGRQMQLDHVVAGWDAGTDPIFRHAPHLVITHAPKADPTAPGACMLALAYLELAAPSFGLGACWTGYLQLAVLHSKPLQAALALPEGDQFCGGMVVGEPRFRYHRLPARREPQIAWR